MNAKCNELQTYTAGDLQHFQYTEHSHMETMIDTIKQLEYHGLCPQGVNLAKTAIGQRHARHPVNTQETCIVDRDGNDDCYVLALMKPHDKVHGLWWQNESSKKYSHHDKKDLHVCMIMRIRALLKLQLGQNYKDWNKSGQETDPVWRRRRLVCP